MMLDSSTRTGQVFYRFQTGNHQHGPEERDGNKDDGQIGGRSVSAQRAVLTARRRHENSTSVGRPQSRLAAARRRRRSSAASRVGEEEAQSSEPAVGRAIAGQSHGDGDGTGRHSTGGAHQHGRAALLLAA